MRRRIPSLGALMAFSAAPPKHLSVTRAPANSLTESIAVSPDCATGDAARREAYRFIRIKKRITLTRAGAAYSTRVAQTIERIERDALESWAMRPTAWFTDVAALPASQTPGENRSAPAGLLCAPSRRRHQCECAQRASSSARRARWCPLLPASRTGPAREQTICSTKFFCRLDALTRDPAGAANCRREAKIASCGFCIGHARMRQRQHGLRDHR